ncbi:MAG: STAS domain-containing protein [Gaiellaceae bacterium]
MASQGISVSVEQDRAIVRLDGEHEAYTADKLAKSLSALLAEAAPVTVDLRHAAFIDSTVLGVLLGARGRAAEAGLDFVLLLGDETGWPVRRILDVTGLRSQFDVVG